MKFPAIVLMGLLSFLIACFSDTKYRKKNGDWYWKDDIMRDVPRGVSVKQLNGHFATAGDQAYFRSMQIVTADGRSFVALNDSYAKDKQTVYFCDDYRDGKEYFMIKHFRVVRVPGADAASFRLLDNYYARDTDHAYFNGVPFAVKDIASFEVLNYLFARDHATGYFLQRPVPGSDGRTFALVDGQYSKDGAHVFYSDSRMENGSLAEVITTTLADVKIASFVSLGHEYSTDSTRVYYKGKVLPDATMPLEILDFFYSKTATHVYFKDLPLKGADAATFVVAPTDNYTARDAHSTYTDGHKAKGTPKQR